MIDIEARLDELKALDLHRRTRLVSGPQGPHALVDGKPVLVLCSNNYLGLADHPRVREAAADAAMRWGVGAGASRVGSGTMTIHRRLEERLAAFAGRQAALLFGSGYLANAGVIRALTRPGDVIFSDELNHASIADGCRLSGADVFVYDHCDVEHLAWGIRQVEGRGALIVTDSVFSLDGDAAPLAEIVELARDAGLRTMVDESHAIGALGPGGRGALAEAGLTHEVDVTVGTLGKALGSYGAYVACDRRMAQYLTNAARTFVFSTAPPPPALAGALAALTLLQERPRRVDKLAANADVLRRALESEDLPVGAAPTHILSLLVGDAAVATRMCEHALGHGVLAEAIRPPAVADVASRVRLTVMATHRPEELQRAALTLAGAARAAGWRPAAVHALPAAAAPPPAQAVFDFEAPEPVRRAA